MQGLSIGAFESIIYAPQLPGGRRGFELEYLNPLIFYRSVEQAIGSPDNAALGLSARWHFLQRFQLYGQFMLDDFNIARTQEGSGYWGNKFGLQGGLKWIDIGGVETLDLQLEYNHLRPYLYSHFNTSANYAHYNQPLAHPQGANAREGVVIVRYRPVSRLRLMMTGGWLRQGRDRNGLNFGGDIFRSNASHDNGEANPDYGNEITQGRRRTLFRLHGRISYQLFRLPLWLEGELYVRDDQTYTNTAALLSLRWGLPARPVRY
jgi:hypothetical protein